MARSGSHFSSNEMLSKILSNPSVYFKRLPVFLAGIFFDAFVKKYHFKNCSFKFPKEFTSVYDRGRAWIFGYETPECVLAQEYLPSNAHLLELGACIGVVSCVTNKKLEKSSQHVVVEGNEAIIPFLKANRDANNCKFKIENCIISSHSNVKFFINKSMVLSGMSRESGREIFCRGMGIHELEHKHAIIFDFLIMDIEGGEHGVVIQNIEYLSKNIRGIILETHPDILGEEKIQEYESALTSAGFKKIRSLGNVEYFEKSF